MPTEPTPASSPARPAMLGKARWRRPRVLAAVGVLLALCCASALSVAVVEANQRTAASGKAGASTVSAPTLPGPVATRGILDPVSYFDRAYQPGSTTHCGDREESGRGELHAWRTVHGGTICYTDQEPHDGYWDGRVVGLEIYFPSRVAHDVAVSTAVALLPTDAHLVGTFAGASASQLADPRGACRQDVYASAVVAAAVNQAAPGWGPDRDKVTIISYSGPGIDGAGQVYDAQNIDEVTVAVGGEKRDMDRVVRC